MRKPLCVVTDGKSSDDERDIPDRLGDISSSRDPQRCIQRLDQQTSVILSTGLTVEIDFGIRFIVESEACFRL